MKKAVEFLKTDKVMKRIIESSGKVKLGRNSEYFHSLVMSIMYQQLNISAAKSIYDRFLALFPDGKPTPEQVLKLKDGDLQSAGVSRQKRGYIFSLAEKFLDGTINPLEFRGMGDGEIIDRLVQVKGIGKWTAQMFLIFSLARQDVFAPDDFGLRKAIQESYGLDDLPKPKQAEQFAERWKPYRSYASLYLWKSRD